SFKRPSPGSTAQWLRRLPPYWDELIFLPLPFLVRFIVRAAQEDPEAARQTIEYLMTFTSQQRVATRALVGVATALLASCQTLSDIGAIANQLSWLPSLPMPGVGPLLARFIEISRQVSTSEPMHLDVPLTLLRTLQADLAQGKLARWATTF